MVAAMAWLTVVAAAPTARHVARRGGGHDLAARRRQLLEPVEEAHQPVRRRDHVLLIAGRLLALPALLTPTRL